MSLLAQAAADAANPVLGVLIVALGGLAGAVFYLPFKKVKNWAWESYWLIYAVVGLLVAPWILAFVTSPNVVSVLKAAPRSEIGWCILFGAMWGVGGLTWGLMIRYLGVGLGLAIGCGLCSAAGTLVPTVVKGEFAPLLHSSAGQASLAAVAISLIGIVFVGAAGMSKESELPDEIKKAAVAEYNFKLGLFVAIFSGLMSAGMNFGLQGGETIVALTKSVAPVTASAWTGMPVLVVVLLGGFVVNAGWCLMLNLKNQTLGDYAKSGSPVVANLCFAAFAGILWCLQFVFMKTGEPALGSLSYISFAALMGSMILFSTILGIFLGEWRSTSARTRGLLALGLVLLVLSFAVLGYAGYLKQS